ncbi:MAG TPA: hypothetical protein VGD42_11910, partial [Lysobacter sp.]
TGVIVSSQETSSRLNGRNVRRYAALIRTADGRSVETTFDGFALPLYPTPTDGFAFPVTGVEFGVRHLASFPQVFSIRTDGDTAYARNLHCVELARALGEARERQRFEPASPEYRRAYTQAMQAHARAGCAGGTGAGAP